MATKKKTTRKLVCSCSNVTMCSSGLYLRATHALVVGGENTDAPIEKPVLLVAGGLVGPAERTQFSYQQTPLHYESPLNSIMNRRAISHTCALRIPTTYQDRWRRVEAGSNRCQTHPSEQRVHRRDLSQSCPSSHQGHLLPRPHHCPGLQSRCCRGPIRYSRPIDQRQTTPRLHRGPIPSRSIQDRPMNSNHQGRRSCQSCRCCRPWPPRDLQWKEYHRLMSRRLGWRQWTQTGNPTCPCPCRGPRMGWIGWRLKLQLEAKHCPTTFVASIETMA